MATTDKKTLLLSPGELAFQLGWSSAASDFSLEQNPYGADQSQHDCWVNGYHAYNKTEK